MVEFVVWLLALRLAFRNVIGSLFFIFVTCLLIFSCATSSDFSSRQNSLEAQHIMGL